MSTPIPVPLPTNVILIEIAPIRLIHSFDPNPEVTDRLTALEKAVSVLSDKIAAATAAFDAAIARDLAEDAANKAKIDELQALVDSGGATPADLAALDDLKAKADALDVTNPAVLAPPVAAAIRAKHGR